MSNQLSAEDKVKQRWPDAHVSLIYPKIKWYAVFAQRERVSHYFKTEAEAWLDAASRLEAEHE